MDIRNSVAVVTGAGQGIGAAVARALAERGGCVAAVDVNADRIDRLAAELTAAGHRATAYPADVSDAAAVDTVVKRVEHECGPIGILVRRLAEPADVAAAVVFLVSDEARHITMHDLYVDGGAALRV